jgi:hypothetical protein
MLMKSSADAAILNRRHFGANTSGSGCHPGILQQRFQNERGGMKSFVPVDW